MAGTSRAWAAGLVLSAVSGAAGAALALKLRPPPAPEATPFVLSLRSEDSPQVPCPTATSLRQLMRENINTSLSGISFALFHDRRGPEERLARVSEQAALLLDCALQAKRFIPKDENAEAFAQHLNFVQQNALGVHSAAMQGDEEGARHWFRHLKQDCTACHVSCRAASDQAH